MAHTSVVISAVDRIVAIDRNLLSSTPVFAASALVGAHWRHRSYQHSPRSPSSPYYRPIGSACLFPSSISSCVSAKAKHKKSTNKKE
ncbi:hypothetical protein Droror1_Dr00025988 [Drosera rotundifolia]